MKKLIWIMLVLMISSYTACHWDYHLSRYLFDQYCTDGRVGYEIYEKVELGQEYFIKISAGDVERLRLDPRFVVSENKAIDRLKFDQDYTFSPYQPTQLSSIGPITAIETVVKRNSDSRVLGKAVSVGNGLGWWIASSGFGRTAESCPDGRDDEHTPKYYRDHDNLIRKIFEENLSVGGAK